MKALLLLSIGFFLAAPPAAAQDTMIHGKQIKLRTGSRLYSVEHLVLDKGKLYHVRGRQETLVDTAFFLPNGMEIHPDGVYRYTNGHIYTLRDGEYLDMEGNRYSSIFNFNADRRMRLRDMDRAQYKQYR